MAPPSPSTASTGSRTAADERLRPFKELSLLCTYTLSRLFPIPHFKILLSSPPSGSKGKHSAGSSKQVGPFDPSEVFADWVSYALYRTRLPTGTVMHALHLLLRVSLRDRSELPTSLDRPHVAPLGPSTVHYTLLLAALVLATDASMDDAYSLHSWCTATQHLFTPKEVNLMMLDLFRLLDWQLVANGERIDEVVRQYEAQWLLGLKVKEERRWAAERDNAKRRRDELHALLELSCSAADEPWSPIANAAQEQRRSLPLGRRPATRRSSKSLSRLDGDALLASELPPMPPVPLVESPSSSPASTGHDRRRTKSEHLHKPLPLLPPRDRVESTPDALPRFKDVEPSSDRTVLSRVESAPATLTAEPARPSTANSSLAPTPRPSFQRSNSPAGPRKLPTKCANVERTRRLVPLPSAEATPVLAQAMPTLSGLRADQPRQVTGSVPVLRTAHSYSTLRPLPTLASLGVV